MEPVNPREVLAYRAASRAVAFDRLMLEADVDSFASNEVQRLLASPLLGVLDTGFFYSAFQSQMRTNVPPLTLRAARTGGLRLFMPLDTLEELFSKLNDFGQKLNVEPEHLERILVEEWSPWITVVDVSSVDHNERAGLVAARDPSDRSVAVLASLLAPCLLLAKDNDFQALGVADSSSPVLAVSATLVVNDRAVQVQGLVMVPVLPGAGIVQGVRWLGERTGVSPWIVGGLALGGGYLLYRRLDTDRRAATKRVVTDVGLAWLEATTTAWVEQQKALRDLARRVVPLMGQPTVDAVVIRALARADGPQSAQSLWEQISWLPRPSVRSVRQTLRDHDTTVGAGRGLWTLGVGFDELLALGQEPLVGFTDPATSFVG